MKEVVTQWLKKNILLLVLLLVVGFIGYKVFKPNPIVFDNSDIKVLEYKLAYEQLLAKEILRARDSIDSIYAVKYKNLGIIEKQQKQLDIRYEKDYKVLSSANADEHFRILSGWLSKADNTK